MRIARPLIHEMESLVGHVCMLIDATHSPRAIPIALSESLVNKSLAVG